ncbi:MAG: hypothetical protein GQE15_39725 [Archangiaceae bacterium]|nr:hypothetical protein [Archangiaceae bacterium]
MSDELPPLGPELEGLFDAAKSDVPSAAAKAKARAMLGLPTPAVLPPSTPTAPTVSTPAPVSSGLGLTAVKGVLVLGLLGGAYVIGVRVGDSRAREEFAALPPKTVVVEKVVEVRVPAEPVVVPPPVAEVVDAGASVLVTPVKTVDVDQPDDLMAELAFVDGARKALAAKDATAALASLSAYDAKFPRGTMRTDAQLLKLEALLLAGRRGDAEALGKKVTSTTDSELVRERVKRLLDAK